MPQSDPTSTMRIKCPNCGQEGALVWERAPDGDAILTGQSRGFHARVTKKAQSSETELICDRCGAAQPQNSGADKD